MKHDAGPVLRFLKQGADAPEAQLSVDPKHEDLLIRLLQPVQHRLCLLRQRRADGLLLYVPALRKLLRQFCQTAVLSQIRNIAVFRDAAEPEAQIAVAAKAVDRLQRFQKGLLRDVLRKLAISRQRAGVEIDIAEMALIKRFKLCHSFTTHP